jgi:DNA primase catalytic core
MSSITEWIKNELYPSLYEVIDRALPEFNFKRKGIGWVSSNKLKVTGEEGESIGKVYVYANNVGYIKDYTRDSLSLITYIMQRDNISFINSVKNLADIVGLELPKGDFNEGAYKSYREKADILEDCNSYFTYCLENSPEAEEVKTYLASRGYSDEDIKAMELGYIPAQDKLFTHLQSKGHSQTLIEEVVKLNKAIGSTHKLTIPYRSGSSIKGFKFRNINYKNGDAIPKYLNTTELGKNGGFFNLLAVKGDKDIVIVEGELDSLSATARGVDNVVACGGSSISSEQIKDAIRKGAKSFTLCFDTEVGKEDKTSKDINTAISVILAEGVNRVYIVNLPNINGGKTDPDTLIKEKGVEAFKEALRGALPYYQYKLQETLSKYGKIEEERGLQPKDIDNLLEEVVETASQILDATDRDRYKKLFTSLEAIKELGISEESISLTVDKLTYTRDKEAQAKEFKKLLSEATQLQDKGETDKALDLINSRLKKIDSITGKGLLPPTITYNNLLEEIANISPAYKTGYPSLDSFIGFTPGAITLIAGRPSHGKTTFMFNLLLQMSQINREESFYFFTYEEPVKNISVKLLNRLIDTDLSGYFREVKELSKPTNYEFIKAYIRANRNDIEEIEEGKREFKELIDSQRIKIIDRNYSVEQLSSLIAYLNKREKIGAVFIDYIQRMNTERRTQDKRTEIAHISDSVLQMAKESGLPIILGAQFNRATQEIKGGKPKLENLKEAGNLEEDANTVLSVYNESREKDESSEGESYKGLREVELEIKTLKNREGEVNQTAKLIFDKWTGVIKEGVIDNFKK